MDESDTSDPSAESGTERGRPRNKIAQLVDEYELIDVAVELEEGWAATGDAHRSLRELADYFNERLLERRLAVAGQRALRGEAETLYSLLTDEDVSEGDRIRARRRLEQQGIDTDGLRKEFVSYQTMRRYLRTHRDVTYTREESDRLETDARNVQQLRGRVEAVTENNLRGLRDSSRLSLGEFRVTTEVHVYCEDCGTRYSANELLEQEGCECG
jgi:hypothetical protein